MKSITQASCNVIKDSLLHAVICQQAEELNSLLYKKMPLTQRVAEEVLGERLHKTQWKLQQYIKREACFFPCEFIFLPFNLLPLSKKIPHAGELLNYEIIFGPIHHS